MEDIMGVQKPTQMRSSVRRETVMIIWSTVFPTPASGVFTSTAEFAHKSH